jgi:hypothetical protein
MTSGNLVAMIPTDQAFAETKRPPKEGWKMPFAPLYAALKEYTDSRISRADFNKQQTGKLVPDSSAGQEFDKRLTFSSQPLLPSLKTHPLYVEYALPG